MDRGRGALEWGWILVGRQRARGIFEPVGNQRTRLWDKVVLQIRAAIRNGDLKPGDRLPPERKLAEIFGTSRTIVREAMKVLAAQGLVEIRHGQGMFVVDRGSDLSLPRPGEPGNLRDLFEIRKVLEIQAAAWAALRAPEERVRRLAEELDAVEREVRARDTGRLLLLGEHDTKFHLAIAEASGNRVLVRVMRDLLDLLAESRAKAWSIPGRPLRSLEEHRRIVGAIAGRDPDRAKVAMYAHLDNVERDILVLPQPAEASAEG